MVCIRSRVSRLQVARSRALRPRLGVLALAAAAAAGSAPIAHAQSGDGAAPQVITVTSQRREQELQKVPLPISTLRAIDLESRAVVDALGVAAYVPNMFASNNTGLGTANVYYIRGLGNTETIATFDPPVGTYIDDVYVSRQNANNFGFFDVERIEVLRGPQGTLFGRNTTGGAIRFIMKRPGFTPGGYLGVGVGSYNEVTARGSYDIPFSQNAASKISFYVNRDKGYVDNITTGEKINKTDNAGLRGALRLRLGADLGWDVSLEATSDDGAAVANTPVGGDRISRTGLRANFRYLTAAGAPLVTGEKVGYGLGNEVRSTAITSNLRWAMSDSTSVEFITGWRDMTQKYGLDFGNTPVPSGGFTIVNEGEHEQFTQEVKLVGDTGFVQWVGGLFYMQEKNRTDFADIFNTAFSGAPLPGATLVLADRVLRNTVETAAAYAQGDFKLAPTLTATVGMRFTHEKKTIAFDENRATAAAAARMTTANLVANGIPVQANANIFTPRAALAWQLQPETMLFASATRGFKSGGWNARATSPALAQPFLPEFIWSYEAGWRTSFAGNRVRFNGTFFDSTTKQLQTPSGFVGPTGAITFITRNFADLGNRGLELDLSADITRAFSVYLAAGFQDAKYQNVAPAIIAQQAACKASIAAGATARPQCQQGIVDRDGNIADPVRVPKQSINLGGTYSFGLPAGMKLMTSAHAAYASRTSVGTAANAFAEDHTIMAASIALVGDKDRWRVTADCSNCTDKVYIQSFLANVLYYNEPRRYSLKFNLKL
jgi:iron complex outermembrane recepter protein